jgi:hypothetical protein
VIRRRWQQDLTTPEAEGVGGAEAGPQGGPLLVGQRSDEEGRLHADRCRVLRREVWEGESSSLPSLAGLRPKIRRFIRRLMQRVA